MAHRELLLYLVDHDSRKILDTTSPTEGLPGMGRREIDDALRQVIHDRYLTGELFSGDGSMSLWSRLMLTVAGLIDLGQWPPPGGEYRKGPWDTGRWGRVAKPLLSELVERPPHEGVWIQPLGDGDAEWQRWTDLLRLMEAGLIEGNLRRSHLQDIRVTRQGREALDPPDDDPLTRARIELDRGAKADAVTAAVEEALKSVLHTLADAHGVQRRDAKGKDLSLNAISMELRRVGAYDEPRRAEIGAWLAIRNAVNHGRGNAVETRSIERMIDGIEGFTRKIGSA